MQKSAIIDTSVLICLYHLGLLQNLFLLYNKVHVPKAVEKEFLKKGKKNTDPTSRFDFIEKFYKDNSIWFFKCNKYRNEIISLYRTDEKLDEGESEVFAQSQELGNISTLLLDEIAARKVAEKNKLAKNGVLYILAMFDLKLKLCNYSESVEKLRIEQQTRFSDKIIKLVYEKCKNETT